MFWTPAFAGVTIQVTFCEIGKFISPKCKLQYSEKSLWAFPEFTNLYSSLRCRRALREKSIF
jgi:hypothetical protein